MESPCFYSPSVVITQ